MEQNTKSNENKPFAFPSSNTITKACSGTPNYLYETIKDMNGFSEKDMINSESIEKIELVLEEIINLNGMEIFINLKSLTLINVNIKKIEHLNELKNLTELWLNENFITKLEGLENLTQLKSLYLCFNQISKIEGLNNLKNLEVLWLCNNSIEHIENLNGLEKLKQLYLAANSIEYIKQSLDNLKYLADFNISGNKIGTFKEALHLNRLPNLQTLAFYDPHFGENPICNLCNYQTYILYNIMKIMQLDTLVISEEAKSFAEATFMKKKMYYNMRIKTIQRSFSTIKKSLKQAKQKKIEFLGKEKASKPEDFPPLSFQILEQEKIYEEIKKKVGEITEFSINRLLMELDTGGNIRLEDGKGNEKWYISCVDLIKSRFHQEEMQNLYDILDVNVNRVIRIHNRFLRNKFEEKMEILTENHPGNYKKSLEYLFYGTDPTMPSELYHILEEGFRPSSEAIEMGLCGYPTLFNSILASDCPRLQSFMKNSLKNKGNKNFLNFDQKLMVIPSGLIVICKVLMLKSAQDNNYPNFDLEKTAKEICKSNPLDTDLLKSSFSSIYRTNGNEEKHKLWFIFDNQLVLPEYLVEFQYSTKYEQNNKMMMFGSETICEINQKDEEFISHKNINKYAEKINEIFDDLSERISDSVDETTKDKSIHSEIKAIDLDRADLNSIKLLILNYFKYALSNNNMPKETNTLTSVGKKKDIEEIIILDFKSNGISILPSFFNFCSKLRYLNLSFNKLGNVDMFENCCLHLIYLNLSHNSIKKLKLKSNLLEYLDVSYNDVANIEYLPFSLDFSNETLIFLNIKGNPLCFNDGRNHIVESLLEKLMKLQFYNNKIFKKILNNQQNFKNDVIVDQEKIYENCRFFQDMRINKDADNNWKKNVEVLIINHHKLISMHFGLNELKNLRKLNLSHNHIEKVEGLEQCAFLEELNLEKNNLRKIEGICHLIYLKKLELGKNKILNLDGIRLLENLMQLSLEDNQITTLIDFPDLKNLMEVYLANNLISNPKEIQNLSYLQKLIILDISGNPLSKDPNSRIFTLYNLKKLKVLDGVSVEITEHQIAKELFTGRLTEEILLSRLNGLSPENVQALDLTNCKLKDFEDIFNENYFPSLVELNIGLNFFTSTKVLGYLPKLKVLIMNANKLETLYLISDINSKLGLNGCQNLEILDVSNNSLKDFNGLQFTNLRKLKILKADHNEISKADSFESLDQLKELDLNNNKIRQFEPNSFMNSNPIKCLKIEDNGLKNFLNIQKLYKLQHLFASNNRINETNDIEKLNELPNLKELELNGTTLSKKPGYRQAILKKLPILLYLDGKEVTNEEREKLDNGMQGPIYEKNNGQNFFAVNPNSTKIPVKLTAVNFDGVFVNVRFPSDNIVQNNNNIIKK